MSTSFLGLVIRCTRWWVRAYTAGLPADRRDARRAEIDSDLWEQHHYAETAGIGRIQTALLVLDRLVLDVPTDLLWRLSAGGVEVSNVREDVNVDESSGDALRGRAPRAAIAVGATVALSFAALVAVLVWGDLFDRSRGDTLVALETSRQSPTATELGEAAPSGPPIVDPAPTLPGLIPIPEPPNYPALARDPFVGVTRDTVGVSTGPFLRRGVMLGGGSPDGVVINAAGGAGSACIVQPPDLVDVYGELDWLPRSDSSSPDEGLTKLQGLLSQGSNLPRSSLERESITREVSHIIMYSPELLQAALDWYVPGRVVTVECEDLQAFAQRIGIGLWHAEGSN